MATRSTSTNTEMPTSSSALDRIMAAEETHPMALVAWNRSQEVAAPTSRGLQRPTRNEGQAQRPALPRDHYTVSWICPLPLEQAAAIAMLDEVHQPHFARRKGDENAYTLGSVHTWRGTHHVVIAGLGSGHLGNLSASEVAFNLKQSFPKASTCFVIGIGGGVPTSNHDLRLGDVVVGQKVAHYDPQTVTDSGKLPRRGLLSPPKELLQALTALETRLETRLETAGNTITDILEQKQHLIPKHTRPSLPDRLYRASYTHVQVDDAVKDWTSGDLDDPCSSCDQAKIHKRKPRRTEGPDIYFGLIASGEILLRSGSIREVMGRQELKALCFEMETAGIMQAIPCLPIRGIADYADSHKNDEWQRYAAATAAACARDLLEEVYPASIDSLESGRIHDERLLEEQINQKADDKRMAEMMASLDFPERDKRRLGVEEQHENTCEWLLEQEEYVSWLNGSQLAEHRGLLWLKGHPGAGKSTIMKFAFEQRQRTAKAPETSTQATDPPVLIVSYFFHARGNFLERSVEGMYRALLHQLLTAAPELQELLLGRDLNSLRGEREILLSLLQKLLRDAILHSEGYRLVFYIDAIDECDEKETAAIMQPIQDIANEIGQSGRFRVFFSSRHYQFLTPRVGAILSLDRLPGHENDMQDYINAHLKIQHKNIAGLKRLLLEMANGVFLWVKLIVDLLNRDEKRGRYPRDLTQLKKVLPKELDDVYVEIIQRDVSDPHHDEFDKKEFLIATTWVLHAFETLTAAEFFQAVESGLGFEMSGSNSLAQGDALQDENKLEKRVMSSTKGLAEVREGKVQFIHESARTFVKDKMAGMLPDSDLSSECCHERLMQYCGWFMNYPLVKSTVDDYSSRLGTEFDHDPYFAASDDLLQAFPFTKYVSQNIIRHANKARSKRDFVLNFPDLVWQKAFWLSTGDPFMKEEGLPTMLFFCAKSGLSDILHCGGFEEKIKSDKAYLNAQCTNKTTALHVAAEEGHVEVVRKLASWGADLTLPDEQGWTPLFNSLWRRHLDVAELLLERGAQLWHGGLLLKTAFVFAGKVRQKSQKHLVPSDGIFSNFCNHDERDFVEAVVFSVMKSGHGSLLRRLVDQGLYLDYMDERGYTVLHDVTEDWNEAAVRTLLGAGADANVSAADGCTALMIAAANGDCEILATLLDHGARINAVERIDGMTALMIAIQARKVNAVKLLIERGADPNTVSNAGDTPLAMSRKRKVDSDSDSNEPSDLRDQQIATYLIKAGAKSQASTVRQWQRNVTWLLDWRKRKSIRKRQLEQERIWKIQMEQE